MLRKLCRNITAGPRHIGSHCGGAQNTNRSDDMYEDLLGSIGANQFVNICLYLCMCVENLCH